jgi:hypothetical protein
MRAKFTVECELPSRVDAEEMRDYIEGEVRSGVGRFGPADPLFHLNREEVQVFIVEPPPRDVANQP